MELTHTFVVAAPIEQTWAALNDIESVAGCFPGAAITSTQGDSFEGTCKVKLGPVALVYNGSGAFAEKDEAAHTMRIEAKGKDKRGNGTAGAQILATLTDTGGQTSVQVVTDLAITGRPAQFGRGVMQDVSDKLLGQFVTCLQDKVGTEAPAASDAMPLTGQPGPAKDRALDDSQHTGDAAVDTSSGTDRTGNPPAAAPSVIPTREVSPSRSPAAVTTENDALDLGVAILPVLLKTYWKPVLAIGAALGAIVYVATR